MNALSTKLGIGVAVVTFALLGAFLWQTTGETTINVTLKTNEDLENGLVGHWTFDGADMIDNVADVSGQGNNGSLVGQTSTTTVQGVLGQALEFDGTDDYVDLGQPSDFDFGTGDLTISTWMYPTGATNDWFSIIDNFNSPQRFSLFISNANKPYIHIGAGAFEGTSGTFGRNTWIHYVASINRSGNVDFYIDGVLDSSVSVSGEVSQDLGDSSVRVGVRGNLSDHWFSGFLDDTRIYNRTLSAEEISRLYDLGGTTRVNTTVESGLALDSGLVGHWTFDGADMVSNVADRSGNANNGSLSGQTSTTTVRGVIGQALEFDGSDDFVNVGDPSSLDISGAYSFSVWAYLKSDTSGFLVHKGGFSTSDGSGLYYGQSTDDFYFKGNGVSSNDFDFASDGSVTINRWYHVVGTYDGANEYLYLDGIQQSTTASAVDNFLNIATDVEVGGDGDQAYDIDGYLDDVRIYNRALSAEEISRLYDLGGTARVNTTVESGLALDSGLVGHWTFDGADLINNVADKSTQGNSGTLTGITSTTTTRGVIGQALTFQGNGTSNEEYINVPDDDSLTCANAVTASAWVRATRLPVAGDVYPIIKKRRLADNSYQLMITETGLARMGIDTGANTAINGTTNVIDGEWHHIAGTWDGSTVRVYTDGVEENSDSRSGTMSNTSNHLGIGWTSGGDQAVFDSYIGDLDDARVYCRALSGEEIQRLYNLGR